MALKISIVVPVYKVEKYITRCLDSLVNQDFESKEIILIDDGSPDNSGTICDEYADRFDCIRVIHQENKGLAEVRNIGIQEAKGEYISFIDSDDYVIDGLYSHVSEIIDQTNAEIVCFGHFGIYDDELNPEEINQRQEKIILLSSSEALDQLFFENNVDVITCNKVIRKALFDGITYPTGKLYEDMFTTYKYIAKANIIACTNKVYYIYCHRKESIGGQKYNEKTLDLAKAATETYHYCLEHCQEINNLHVGYLLWMTIVANIMIRSHHNDPEYFKTVRVLSKRFRKEIINNTLLNRTRKMELVLFGVSFTIYKIAYMKYIKRHRFG